MGHRFSGALAYADDLTLLSPIRSFVVALVGECERYAIELDIMLMVARVNYYILKGGTVVQLKNVYKSMVNMLISLKGRFI